MLTTAFPGVDSGATLRQQWPCCFDRCITNKIRYGAIATICIPMNACIECSTYYANNPSRWNGNGALCNRF